MFPNPKRTSFSNHIYSDKDVPLLKQAAIYGPNGSGKSNFIKAIWFLRSIILKEDFLGSIDIEDYMFQLTKEKKPSIEFEVEFFYKEKYLIYYVSARKNSIEEHLYISGLGKRTDIEIFTREGTEITPISDHYKTSAKQLLRLNPLSSIIPLNQKFPVILATEVKNTYDWFKKQLDIISINTTMPMIIDIMSKNSRLLNFTNKIFEEIGIGVESIKISDTPFEKWISNNKDTKKIRAVIEKGPLKPNTGISRLENKRPVLQISIKEGVQIVQEFLFNQLGASGYKKDMKISAQSDGTVRLLTLIPGFYHAIHEGKVVFIDEIDNSIHPQLVFALLKFFGGSSSKGQLIFTSHSTILINQQELLRPDEIWLTEKEQGNTKMYSLDDFKIHNTINIENGYLSGRFGAIPEIGEINQE
ncbi:MAG: ATP-binding protein [Bacteroidales bacterium]|nr:ATP-binding protein [Bacteroidales bacterium]